MRAHRDEFEPFVAAEALADGGGGGGGGGGEAPGADASPAAAPPADPFEAHCAAVEHTAAWGGQAEIAALAAALPAEVTVLAVGLPPVVMGEGGGGGEKSASSPAPPPRRLTICYLRHALALGAHYNSVAPLEVEGEEAGEE
jgi:OTU domain-containing protein 6